MPNYVHIVTQSDVQSRPQTCIFSMDYQLCLHTATMDSFLMLFISKICQLLCYTAVHSLQKVSAQWFAINIKTEHCHTCYLGACCVGRVGTGYLGRVVSVGLVRMTEWRTTMSMQEKLPWTQRIQCRAQYKPTLLRNVIIMFLGNAMDREEIHNINHYYRVHKNIWTETQWGSKLRSVSRSISKTLP